MTSDCWDSHGVLRSDIYSEKQAQKINKVSVQHTCLLLLFLLFKENLDEPEGVLLAWILAEKFFLH